MKPKHRITRGRARGIYWYLFLLIVLGILPGAQPALSDGAADEVVGDGTPASCTEENFDTALTNVQSSGGGTITFNCGSEVTIPFSSSKIIMNSATVTINGGDQITLSGVNKVRHFRVDSGAALTVRNITLTNGFDDSYGGGSILNLGVLALENTTIQNSNVDSGHSGGAIMSLGSLSIDNSLIENNGGGSAGGLFLIGEDAVTAITGSTLRDNHTTSTQYGKGGAISSWNDADVTIHSSTLTQNQARDGGAIYNNAAVITIEAGTIIEDNNGERTGGGIWNGGGLINISDAELTNNHSGSGLGDFDITLGGGGISSADGKITLFNTVVSNNTSKNGGGIWIFRGSAVLRNTVLNSNLAGSRGGATFNQAGNVVFTNVTISNNTAGGGGGFYNFSHGNASLIHVTMSGNSLAAGGSGGGGIMNDTKEGNVTLKNVIINEGIMGVNCFGIVTSNGFNLSSDDHCRLNQGGDRNNVDPLLGPLADNGGFTPTHMLLSGSPAIDAGQCVNDVPTDQRGLPRLQGAACDIGAVEVQPDDGTFSVYLPLVIN